MKKGINIWSFPPGMGVVDCMRMAKEAGFDGIELVLSEHGEIHLASTAQQMSSYRRQAERIGIEVSGLATGLFWCYSLTSNRAETREKAKGIVKRMIDAAEVVGADTVLVVPGIVGVDFKADEVVPDAATRDMSPFYDVVDYDVAYERSFTAIRELAGYAEARKVFIGIENVWSKFLLSPLEMRDFVDKIGSPYVGVYFDVGNVVYCGYPNQWIKILGRRIKKLHFKDYRRAAGGLCGFVDLLSGDVDYGKVIEALRAIGYNGYANAEMTPPYRTHPEQIIFNTSASMDRILGRK